MVDRNEILAKVKEKIMQAKQAEQENKGDDANYAENKKAKPVHIPNLVEFLQGADPEQIRALKQLLEQVPEKISTDSQVTKVHLLRKNGKYVVKYSDAYEVLEENQETGLKERKLKMKVSLLDPETKKTETIEDDYNNVVYNYEKVSVTVDKEILDPKEIIEGETKSQDTGQMVEMVNRIVKRKYQVTLPEGIQIIVPERVVNMGIAKMQNDIDAGDDFEIL